MLNIKNIRLAINKIKLNNVKHIRHCIKVLSFVIECAIKGAIIPLKLPKLFDKPKTIPLYEPAISAAFKIKPELIYAPVDPPAYLINLQFRNFFLSIKKNSNQY